MNRVGVDQTPFFSYGNLKGKCYTEITPEFTSQVKDGNEWVLLPKN